MVLQVRSFGGRNGEAPAGLVFCTLLGPEGPGLTAWWVLNLWTLDRFPTKARRSFECLGVGFLVGVPPVF